MQAWADYPDGLKGGAEVIHPFGNRIEMESHPSVILLTTLLQF